jgi:hypothetical protein
MGMYVIEKFDENLVLMAEWEGHFLGDGLAFCDVGWNDTSLGSLCIYPLVSQCCVYWRGRSDPVTAPVATWCVVLRYCYMEYEGFPLQNAE